MESDDYLSSNENLLGLAPYIFEPRREYETSYSTTESVDEHETGDQIGPSYQMQISGNLSNALPIASNHFFLCSSSAGFGSLKNCFPPLEPHDLLVQQTAAQYTILTILSEVSCNHL